MFVLSFYGTYCWVMKLADMPSCLGGKDHGINQVAFIFLIRYKRGCD